MKTVCKKLLSLMLVAMLLVSAIPFASADELAIDVPVFVTIDGEAINTQKTLTVTEAGVVLDEATAMGMIRDSEGRAFSSWTNASGKTVTGYTLSYEWLAEHIEGYSLTINLVSAAAEEPTEAPTEEPTEEPTETPTEATTTVYFNNELAGKVYTRAFENGEEVEDLPGGVNVKGYDFKGWYSGKNGTGSKLVNGDTWYSGKADTYYAYYVESVDDGVSTLSVYVRFYVGGVQQGNTQLLYKHEFEDGDNMFTWLSQHESTTANAIFALDGSDGYEWNPRYYYDYTGNEPLSEQDLIADGNKSVVVKVYSKNATEANVLLYVHKTKATATPSIYEMAGYTAGNTVTYAAVKAEVKEHYTGSSMTIQGLYDQESWEQLLNGENPTAANGIKVESNGTTKIHVILKNATASSSSDDDDSNPKTGDYITVAVATMVVAAAALISVIELKKRKMI